MPFPHFLFFRGMTDFHDKQATFNPSFGQGMTQALQHAYVLQETLDKHLYQYPVHDLTGVSIKFQHAAAGVANNCWSAVEPSDLAWPSTEGKRTKYTLPFVNSQ